MKSELNINCAFEKDKYYNIKLDDGTVIINFFVNEIIEGFILGSSCNYRIKKIKTTNDGKETFPKGEFIKIKSIRECEFNPYQEMEI